MRNPLTAILVALLLALAIAAMLGLDALGLPY